MGGARICGWAAPRNCGRAPRPVGIHCLRPAVRKRYKLHRLDNAGSIEGRAYSAQCAKLGVVRGHGAGGMHNRLPMHLSSTPSTNTTAKIMTSFSYLLAHPRTPSSSERSSLCVSSQEASTSVCI